MADDKASFLIDFTLKNGPAAVQAITSMRKGAGQLVSTLTSLKTAAAAVFTGYAVTKAVQFGKELASIQSHVRRTETVFGRFGDAGVKALDDIRRYADKSGIGLEHAEELGTKLLTTFGPRASANVTKLLADTQAANALTAQSFDQLGDKVLEFGSKSKLGGGDIEGFSKVSGYSIKELKEQLSKDMKVSTTAVGTLIEKGKLLAPVLLGAVNKLNKARLKTDALGVGAIEDASKDAEKQLQRLSDVWLNVQRQLAKEIFTEDNVRGLNEFITKLPGYVDDAKKAFGEFGAGFKEGFKPALDGFSKASGVGKDFSSIDWGKVGSDVGKVASAITTIVNGLAKVVGFVAEDTAGNGVVGATHKDKATGQITHGLDGRFLNDADRLNTLTDKHPALKWIQNTFGIKPAVVKQAEGLGKDAAQGYAKGIAAGKADVQKAGSSTAETAAAALQKKQQSNSPSKVFAGLGTDAIAGYALGIEQSTPKVASAIDSMMGAAMPGAIDTAMPGVRGSGAAGANGVFASLLSQGTQPGTGGSSIGDVNVVVNLSAANANAEDIGSKVGSAVRQEIERMLNRAQLAGG